MHTHTYSHIHISSKITSSGITRVAAVAAIVIVQLIVHFLWDHSAHYGIFENGVLLMLTPEGVSSVANFITAYEVSQ